MKIAASTLAKAADGLLESALLGNDWRESLAQFAPAAGAVGATLVRDKPQSALKSQLRSEFVLATEPIAEFVADYLAGGAPPDPRTGRVSPRFSEGFVTDLDQFSREEIGRSPFYEEFLRPRHLRWHACARIDSSPGHGQLYLSLKRSIRYSPYYSAEINTLNRMLPKLQMAASISRAILRAERRGHNGAFDGRGEALFELDHRGYVITFNRVANSLIGGTLALVHGRLLAPFREDSVRLERAIAAPLGSPPQIACVVLNTPVPGRRLVLRTLPVIGKARDIFGASAALAVVTIWEKPSGPPDNLVKTLRQTFDLTGAEARVAALVGLGVTLTDSSRILTISPGTARNYFKAAQAKIGISRQAELAGLVGRMQL